jgi:hypothetical protein
MSSKALLDQQKKYPKCEFLPKLIEKFHIFWEIYEACGKRWEENCGSYLFDGTTYDYCPLMYEKQKLLYDKAKKATRALEIGVYHGHSLFIMLLAKPDLTVHLIDLRDEFALPAAQILANHFPQAKLTFMKGDSQIALPQVNMTFDLFHIDGLHTEEYVEQEWKHCVNRFMPKDCVIVYDDYDCCKVFIESSFRYNIQNFKAALFTFSVCFWRNACIEYSYCP